jgi:hypothetical protein
MSAWADGWGVAWGESWGGGGYIPSRRVIIRFDSPIAALVERTSNLV